MKADSVVGRRHSRRPDFGRMVGQTHKRVGSVHGSAAANLPFWLLNNSLDLFGLGLVVSQLHQVFEVSVIDTTSDVFAGKDRAVELFDGRVKLLARGNKIVKGLVNDEVDANVLGNFFGSSIVGDELFGRRHIDTIDVGVTFKDNQHVGKTTGKPILTGWEEHKKQRRPSWHLRPWPFAQSPWKWCLEQWSLEKLSIPIQYIRR